MKMSLNTAAAVTASASFAFGFSVYAAEQGELLFQDSLNADTSANWTLLGDAPDAPSSEDWLATFAWDYSPYGIPLAPNSVDGTTKGLRLEANMSTGQEHAITLVPNGQNFSGNYVLKFDVWLNFNGYLGNPDDPSVAAGGWGSTEYAVFGVGTDGATVHQWSPLASSTGLGAWFSFSGDGGSTFDYRAFREATSIVAAEGAPYSARASELFDETTDARNHYQPYYHSIFPGGVEAPWEQFSMYWVSDGATAPGVAGFTWNEVTVEVMGDTVRWYINDLIIAEMTPETAGGEFSTAGNIFIGYADPFESIAAQQDPEADLNFGLFANVRVYSLPSDATGFAQWATDNIADETARGALDNPAGDGISNLLKYALGLDPAVADLQGLPVGIPEEDGGEAYLTLTVAKNAEAADVTLAVEASGDLAVWDSGSASTTVLVDDATTLKVRDNTALSAAGSRFIRLKASHVE